MHFPPNRDAERWLDRAAAADPNPPAEVLPESDEIDPTLEWLAQLAAGRIEMK